MGFGSGASRSTYFHHFPSSTIPSFGFPTSCSPHVSWCSDSDWKWHVQVANLRTKNGRIAMGLPCDLLLVLRGITDLRPSLLAGAVGKETLQNKHLLHLRIFQTEVCVVQTSNLQTANLGLSKNDWPKSIYVDYQVSHEMEAVTHWESSIWLLSIYFVYLHLPHIATSNHI